MIENAIDWIGTLSPEMFLHVFWYSLVFEVPRYLLPALLATGAWLFVRERPSASPPVSGDRVVVLVVGHNEGDSVRRCITSLYEQTLTGFEIVCVSDGSTDNMADEIRALEREGKVSKALTLDLRGGKTAGTNLAAAMSDRELIVIVDCDSSFERDCLERMVAPFADPRVGVVCGAIYVRNFQTSMVAGFQAIEYIVSIGLGKRFSDAVDQVTCASGALSALRRSVMMRLGAMDATGGEDLEFTMRAREAGIPIRFAPDAVCYTDAPHTLAAFLRQRKRWEGDSIDVRYRRHLFTMNPFDHRFRWAECYHQLEFLLVNVGAAVVFPVYALAMFAWYGPDAVVFLLGVVLFTTAADLFLLILGNLVVGHHARWNLLGLCLFYSVFQTIVMRAFRAAIYVRELFLLETLKDPYRPSKVRFRPNHKVTT